MKQHKAATLPFSIFPTFLNHSSAMDTKGPIKFASDKKHCYRRSVDHLSIYIVTIPTEKVILIML